MYTRLYMSGACSHSRNIFVFQEYVLQNSVDDVVWRRRRPSDMAHGATVLAATITTNAGMLPDCESGIRNWLP